MRAPVPLVLALVSALVLSACTREQAPTIETAEVRSGEVIQTVQAPAQLDASDRAEVSAPLGGEVEELLVGDGDIVAAGDTLVRLASDSLDAQIAQAESVVASAEEVGAASAGAGFDLSPVLGAFRGQLDTVFPALIEALGSQLATTESTLAAAVAGVEETTRATDELGRDLQAALAEAQATLDDLRLDRPDLDGAELDLPELDLPELDLPERDLPELELPGRDAVDPPSGLDAAGITEALSEAQGSAADARRQLRDTELAFRSASRQLQDAEQELEAQAEATSAAQAAAVDAQVEQARLALEATRSRTEDLLVRAPIGGVVELTRGGGGGGAPALDGLPADLGDLAGDLGAGDGLGGLLGGDGDGPGTATNGPIAVGVEVGAGQPLLSVFDLSGFVARVEVDEIDVVQVQEGQLVTIRVDAFPGAELEGRVDHVALAPSRDVIGGALYPVTVVLSRVPEDVALRVGLTASAEIEVRRLEGETVVPTSALLRRGEGEVVHVVRDGIAVEVPVELLAIGDQDAAIAGEVRTGERVVTIGVELIADGDEVPT